MCKCELKEVDCKLVQCTLKKIQINRFSMTSLCDDALTEEIHLHFLIVWYFNYLIYICAV